MSKSPCFMSFLLPLTFMSRVSPRWLHQSWATFITVVDIFRALAVAGDRFCAKFSFGYLLVILLSNEAPFAGVSPKACR